MASQSEVVDRENAVAKEKSGKDDEVATVALFAQLFQALPTKESAGNSTGNSKPGIAKSGAGSSFNALFQAPLGTEIHGKRQEIDDLYHCMREILHNPKYMDGDRLSPADEIAVRDVLQNHPNCKQKTGMGIDYIKIQKIYDDVTRCFWVVRVDGTETDFSFHKCLKAKATEECPGYRNDSKQYVPRCRGAAYYTR